MTESESSGFWGSSTSAISKVLFSAVLESLDHQTAGSLGLFFWHFS
jgi:hypothetical protein